MLQQQEKAQESHNSAVPEPMFYVGDTVWAMNFAAAAPKWLPWVLQHCLSPVSFTVDACGGDTLITFGHGCQRRMSRRHHQDRQSVLPARAVLPAREDIAEAATMGFAALPESSKLHS